MVVGFWHAAVTVSDMDSALVFYRDCLGLEVDTDRRLESSDFVDNFYGRKVGSPRVVFMNIPGSDAQLELFAFDDVESRADAALPWDHGSGHFCLYVTDADEIHRRAEKLGFTSMAGVVTIPGGPEAGAKVAYLIDGDGYHVEIFQRA